MWATVGEIRAVLRSVLLGRISEQHHLFRVATYQTAGHEGHCGSGVMN